MRLVATFHVSVTFSWNWSYIRVTIWSDGSTYRCFEIFDSRFTKVTFVERNVQVETGKR